MNLFPVVWLAAALAAGAPLCSQHDHDKQHEPAKAEVRAGDPFSFGTCPISGKKLGSMGAPFVKVYEGREVRFCCKGCLPKFEKDLLQNFAKIDAKIIADQAALYPLKTSIVTGRQLPARPVEFVYGNRLIRIGFQEERAAFDKAPARFLAVLDKAVVESQGEDYPLMKCPVSGEEYGGDTGEPVDLVIAGRLVRLGCRDCRDDVEKEPSRFVALVDAAMRSKKSEEGGGDHEDHEGGKGRGGGNGHQ